MDLSSAAQWLDDFDSVKLRGRFMTALEIRPEEIGSFDPAAVQARRERLWGKPKPVVFFRPQPPREAVALYDAPIGPNRPQPVKRDVIDLHRPFKSDFARIRDEELARAGVTIAEFNGHSRRKHISEVRRLIWFRASTETNLSLPRIGQLSGGKDHTSVLTAICRYRELFLGEKYARLENNRERARQRHHERQAAKRAARIAAE